MVPVIWRWYSSPGKITSKTKRYVEDSNDIKKTKKIGLSRKNNFKGGGGIEKKKEWKWKGQQIEQAKEIKYLGYYFQEKKNNMKNVHIKERIKNIGASMEHRIMEISTRF